MIVAIIAGLCLFVVAALPVSVLLFSARNIDARPVLDLMGKLYTVDPGPGLWGRQIDDHWTIWINMRGAGRLVHPSLSIPSDDCYVEYNGEKFAFFSLRGFGAMRRGRGMPDLKLLEAAIERAIQIASPERTA